MPPVNIAHRFAVLFKGGVWCVRADLQEPGDPANLRRVYILPINHDLSYDRLPVMVKRMKNSRYSRYWVTFDRLTNCQPEKVRDFEVLRWMKSGWNRESATAFAEMVNKSKRNTEQAN